jgi:N-acetylneuraminic acid mutarotase
MVILENLFQTNYKMKVFWYDFENDAWQQLEDFPGKDRTDGVMFSVKNKVYFGLGMQKNDEAGLKDIWEYDLITKKWTQLTDYPGTGSTNVAHVKKGNSIYLGMGYSSIVTPIGTSRKFIAYDFWKFTP